MNTEGSLSLMLHWDRAAIDAVRVHSRRPVYASRMLEGRPVAEAVAMVPRLFSVCRRSQHAAARIACAYALQGAPESALVRHAELQVLAECALESLWRLFLDWPPLAGAAPRAKELAAIRSALDRHVEALQWRAFADALERFLESSVYGEPLAAWESGTLRAWLTARATPTTQVVASLLEEETRTPRAPSLPWLDANALRADIAPSLAACEEFPAAPVWHSQPAETGACVRAASHPKVRYAHDAASARLVARLVELSGIPARIRAVEREDLAPAWVRGAQTARGRGLAAIETSRGTLIHDVTISGDSVQRWRIVAPTEWNFHPRGAYVQGLVGAAAASAEAARKAGERFASLLDPCVAAEVQVAHA